MKNIILIIIVFAVLVPSCKPKVIPPEELTFSEILLLHQWRKTEVAVYNTSNELEEYLFTFENAEDCEKNTFWNYTGYSSSSNYGGIRYSNFCLNIYWYPYKYSFKNDSLIVESYESATSLAFYSAKHINYYDKANYILDYDTIINEENKKIKETYTAFPKN